MSDRKRNLNKEIIALFSGQASVVTTPKLYIQLTGNHSLAVVLNQCVYWSNKSECKDGWFYKEYEEWFEEVHIPERTLRRRFDKLEELGWVTTKVKKVHGLNVKHVCPHMEKIIESISFMLNQECPNRPDCPNGEENEQKPCTKVAPTGQVGRSEPATLADSSIYTDEYSQMSVGDTPSAHTNIIPKTPKEKCEAGAFDDVAVQALFKMKFEGRNVTYQDLFTSCQQHYEQKGAWVTLSKWESWVKREKVDNHDKKGTLQAAKLSPKQQALKQQWGEYNEYVKRIEHDRMLKLPTKEIMTFEEWSATNANQGRMQEDNKQHGLALRV